VPNGQHAFACSAARHALCAGKQGKFWPFHDQVYDHQEELSTALLAEIVQKVGLDSGALAACLADPATETQMQKEMQMGEMINLESTPTVVINGRKLTGAKSPAELEALFQQLKAEAHAK
jgi:protein-disulfide isomerase